MNNLYRLCIVALLAAGLAGCMQYSKTCSGGVCTVTKNGATTYEGDPAKVAQLQAKKKADDAAAAERLRKLDAAPRRTASDPVKVALMPSRGSNPELSGLETAYTTLIRRQFGSNPAIELVPEKTVLHAVKLSAQLADDHPGFRSEFEQRQPRRLRPVPEDMNMLRRRGIDADIFVFYDLNPETKTGLISGGKGSTGLAQVENVRFDVELASPYSAKTRKLSAIGRSTSGIALAGVSDGKVSGGELQGRRDPEQDAAAIQELDEQVRGGIDELKISLPTAEAVRGIDGEPSASGSSGNEALQKFRNLFSR